MTPFLSEAMLEVFSGLSELVEPFAWSDGATIGAVSEGVIVRSRTGEGREGVLLALAFEANAEDLVLSPVYVVDTGKDGTIRRKRNLFFNAPVGDMSTPLALPRAVFFKADSEIGLAATNGEATAQYFRGLVVGASWNEKHATRVRDELAKRAQRAGAPWAPGSVFGGA